MNRSIEQIRIIGVCEGISYLVLLCVAMPLKYLMGEPLAVRIVGALHGVLFIVYVAAAIRAALINRWKLSFLVKVFVASMLPFGPFIVDRSLRKNTPNGEME